MERGIIKWRPFDSVTNTKALLSAETERINIKKMPLLSDEQIEELEKQVLFAFYTHKIISIKYYKNNNIYDKNGTIKKIDGINHTITLVDNTTLFFNQIINIQ
jgi:hypothetical protein